MSRAIMFRAWNPQYKLMSQIVSAYDDDKFVFIAQNDEPTGEVAGIKDLLLLQYTGLKDKNGTEIYEGDIVDAPIISVKYELKNAHNKVIWYRGGFYLQDNNKVVTELGKYNTDEILEVIGNVYETPELLP